MCYSAQILADYRRYVRDYGADISLEDFHDLFWRRARGADKVKLPKAVADAFMHPQGDAERAIKSLIDEHDASESTRFEQDLFKQRRRLADAERALQSRPTKAAADSARIAAGKIEQLRGWLADLRRTAPEDRDARIFPGHYAPLLVLENGRRVVRPMRYQCRPAGKPASFDGRFPGTYNARRDNLHGFWGDLFGYHHGVMVASAFFENVVQPDGSNAVLEFSPRTGQPMLVACLWSRWTAPGQPPLLSFAAITDEPPAEIAAAGHDRCVIPIKPANLDAWLAPDPARLADQQAILDDRERPPYAWRLAA